MKNQFNTRRHFIRQFSATAAAVTAGLSLSACGGSTAEVIPVLFLHGVASGDPLSDRVILWTRISPQLNGDGKEFEVTWTIASDAEFTKTIATETVTTNSNRDYTVKVDVTGLSANTVYFYKFECNQTTSPVGRTKTIPTSNVSKVKLAVATCANYPAGFFHVYNEIAQQSDLDAVLHLGDYIYEYPADGYASQDAQALNRVVDPKNETVTLTDYRTRYSIYRRDLDLQKMHATHPIIAVWDDHEFANNTWMNGAENHTPSSEGPFSARRTAALQAYHEWMPIRLADSNKKDKIYRSFDFGTLLSLHMLDTRLIGRDQQLEYSSYIGADGQFNSSKFTADMGNPTRQLLGTEQAAWLQNQLAQSKATWQVLGQQILMARMNIPAPLVMSKVSFSDYMTMGFKAQTNPASLTETEKAILAQPAIPYNLDAWDGYPVARETILGTVKALNKNLIVLAGDTHNAWASNLTTMQGDNVGVEFATSSVSSPGFEEYFPKEDPAKVAAGLEQIIDPLVYAETKNRGYMIVSVTQAEAQCEWKYISTVKSKTYTKVAGRTLKVLPGNGNRKLQPV